MPGSLTCLGCGLRMSTGSAGGLALDAAGAGALFSQATHGASPTRWLLRDRLGPRDGQGLYLAAVIAKDGQGRLSSDLW